MENLNYNTLVGVIKLIKEIKIENEYIKLDSLLKLSDVVSTGGQAKYYILDGKVIVNGEVTEQRGKKIRVGDIVEVDGVKIKIV